MTDQEQREIFAKNLNNLLYQNGKTQREVAEAISVSPQTFNTWCQAIALPRMGKVQRLADYFHVPKSHLIDNVEDALPAAAPCSPASGYGKLLDNLHINNSSMLEIVKICSNLNQEGVEKVLGYAQDLEASGLYNICNSDELLEKKAN